VTEYESVGDKAHSVAVGVEGLGGYITGTTAGIAPELALQTSNSLQGMTVYDQQDHQLRSRLAVLA
jgi:hypothetical protein